MLTRHSPRKVFAPAIPRSGLDRCHRNVAKKSSHTAEAFKGRTNSFLGRLTGNRRLRAEGRGDQVKGDTEQAGAKIKDAFKH